MNKTNIANARPTAMDKNKYLEVFWNNQLNWAFGLVSSGIGLIPAAPLIICLLKMKKSPKMLIIKPERTVILIT